MNTPRPSQVLSVDETGDNLEFVAREDVDSLRTCLEQEILRRRVALERRRRIYEAETVHLQKAFVEEVRVASKQERRLRSQLNALAPVSMLPREMLESIFSSYLRVARREHRDTRVRRNSWERVEPEMWREETHWLAWTKITQVCRHWRSVALSFSPLWSWIVPNPGLANMGSYIARALSLSRRHPLTIDYKHIEPSIHVLGPSRRTYYHSTTTASSLLSKLPRVESLKLPISDELFKLLASDRILTVEAPLLRDLYLDMRCDTSVSTLTKLPSPSLPRLRSLTMLEGPHTLLTALVTPSLTSLSIRFPQPLIPTSVLISLLRTLPRLETLALEGCESFEVPTAGAEQTTRVSLPRLTRLKYIDACPENPHRIPSTVFDWLDFPPTAKVTFYLRLNGKFSFHEHVDPSLSVALAKATMDTLKRKTDTLMARSLSVSAYDYVSPWGGDPNAVAFRVWNDEQRIGFRNEYGAIKFDQEPDLTFHTGGACSAQRLSTGYYIWEFIERVDVSAVTRLCSAVCNLEPDEWTRLFRALPQIERLTICADFGNAFGGFTSAFSGLRAGTLHEVASGHYCSQEERLSCPLPRLHTLHVARCKPVDVSHLERLVEGLKVRKSSTVAAHLRLFKITQSSLPNRFLALVQSLKTEGVVEAVEVIPVLC